MPRGGRTSGIQILSLASLQSPTHRLLFSFFPCSVLVRLGFRSLIPRKDSRWRCSLARSCLPACMGLDVAEIGMGLDLGLDLRLFAARSAGGMAAAAAKGAPAGIQACIRSLEEERRKIEVFRRELPLCVRLLADVIEELKEEAAKKNGDLETKVDDGDKKKWMSTAQLWVDSDAKSKCEKEQRSSEMTSPEPKLLDGPMPIRAFPAVASPPPCFRRDDNPAGTVGLTGLSLLPPSGKASLTPAPAAVDEHRQNITARFSANMPQSSSAPGLNLHAQSQQQQQSRKARRCWSPELHRQFVAALHQLGGPQVATPKQIREVMQVDGLTNDEVKSHLQKYRLHNRRSPGVAPVSQSIMLVGGGLWVPQEQSSSQSGSPQGPLQFSGSGVAISAATVGGDSSSSSDEGDKSDEGYSRK